MDLVHVQTRRDTLIPAAEEVIVVRILVAIEPLMYREVLVFHFREQRPRSEVDLASSENLSAEAERISPHLIIANEVPPSLKETGVFWVEVRVTDGLQATISANVCSSIIHDVSLQDLLAVVDKTEEELLAHGSQ